MSALGARKNDAFNQEGYRRGRDTAFHFSGPCADSAGPPVSRGFRGLWFRTTRSYVFLLLLQSRTFFDADTAYGYVVEIIKILVRHGNGVLGRIAQYVNQHSPVLVRDVPPYLQRQRVGQAGREEGAACLEKSWGANQRFCSSLLHELKFYQMNQQVIARASSCWPIVSCNIFNTLWL